MMLLIIPGPLPSARVSVVVAVKFLPWDDAMEEEAKSRPSCPNFM